MKYTIHQNETMFLLSIVDLIFGVVQFSLHSIILNSIFFGLLLIYMLYKYKWKENMFLESLILLYYSCFQLALRGVPQIWLICFALGKQTVQLGTLSAIFIYTCFDFQPLKPLNRYQEFCEQILIIMAIVFCRYNFSSLHSKAKQNLAQQISSSINYCTYDQNSDELENSITMDQLTVQTTTILSSRCENQKLQQHTKREFKIKCYTQNISNNFPEQLESIPVVFDSIRAFIEAYSKKSKQMDKQIIIAHEIDKFTGQKLSYRLHVKSFRWFKKSYFVAAFVNLNLSPKKENKNIEKFKLGLSKIFTHKLKTPLNTTLGFLQAIVIDNNGIDEKIKENFLKPAYINSKIQYYQVQDVLDYVNQAELISYKVTKVNLHKTLQLIYDTIELQCRAKQIKIVFRINSQEFSITDKPIYLQTDQQRLERILFNLLNKSYRHTPIKGLIRLDVDVMHDCNQVQFKINDCILGFKQEQVDQINSFAKQQNKSTTLFRNSIVKSQKFKFSLTLQITNKLIYFLSDFQCSLQVINSTDEGASYVFFISVNCQRSSFQSADLSQGIGSGRSKNSSVKQSMPNHVLLFTRTQAQSCRDRVVEESKIEAEPLANRPLQLSTNMLLENSPVSTLLKSQALQKSIIPYQKSVYQKELNDKSLSISIAFDHTFNIKRIADSIDIRQDMNQTIMLVDDEPFNHDTLKIMLKSLGFKNFISAYNGQQCIELVQNHHRSVKIIFMDLDMPIMGGVRATSILVSQMQENQIDYIPIVACTAHDDKETHKECIEAGMIFMLPKPVFLRSLQEAFLKINEIKTKSQNILLGSKVISSSIK